MIFLYVLASLSALLTFSLQLLPGETFLPLPTVAYDAVETVASYAGWALGLAGPDIKATILTILALAVPLEITVLLWRVLVKWRPPILGKYFR